MLEEFPCFDRAQVKTSYPYRCPIPNHYGTYEAAIARIMWVLQVGTQKAMCEALGVFQSAASDAKRRQVIPAQWLVRLQLQWNVSPLWVLTGYIPPVKDSVPTQGETEWLMALVR